MKTPMTVIKAAEELLEKSGKPMHYKDITRQILHNCALFGKTPHETVRSLMATNPKFIRVDEGTYALSKWKKFTPARFAKDIAYDILKSKDRPMSLNDLGKKILDERKFKDGPKMVVRNAIRHDRRFITEKETELVTLTEWGKNENFRPI